MPAPLERTSVPGIFKRGDAYVVVYRFDGDQHKRTCRSFADARSVKAQLKADIDRGEYQRGGRTFEDYARTWVDSYTGRTTRGFRESTRRGYRRAIEKRAIPYFSKRSKVMTDIGPPEIRGFIAWLFDERAQGRALTLGTVRADVAAVRALFATAVEDGVLRHNPALGVRISHPRPTVATDAREQRRALDQEDLARFLAACPDDWRLFFELLTHTGMRIGEAIELRWKDIDLGRKRVCVRRQIHRGRVSDPKSRFGRRDIPLSTSMARRLWAAKGPSEGLVFTDRLGRQLTDHWLRHNVLEKAAENAELPWIGFHTFRHTCASLLFAGEKNIKQVQEWLGHSDPGFTLRTYVHLIDDGLGDAEFLDAATGGNTGGNTADRNAPEATRSRGAQTA